MRYRLYGDIIRAAIIEVEAANVDELSKKIHGDPILLDNLKYEIVQEEKHFAAFDMDGTILDENGKEIELT